MVELFLAALTVVFVMNLFLFVLLRRITSTLEKKSKSYLLEKLQVYDGLIEEKNQELDLINHEILRKKKEIPVVVEQKVVEKEESLNVDIKIPEYRDDLFFEELKKVKTNFNINNLEIVNQFLKTKINTNTVECYQFYRKLRNKFSFDAQYNLSTLDKEEQISIIEAMLDPQEQAYLKQYIEQQDEFNSMVFFEYLDNLIKETDPTVYIKTGSKEENFDSLNSFVKTEYDDTMYLGVKIIYRNQLYDYAVD